MLRYSEAVSATAAAPRKRKRTKRKNPGWRVWWPLVLAILLTPLAVRGASLLALAGPGALRALFPFAALARSQAGLAMWAQLPVYGLVLALFARRRRLGAGLPVVLLVHAAALAAAWLLRPQG